MTWRVIQADCLEAMAAMDEASVDAIVTDPPYGLEFMGKDWDGIGRRIGHPLDPSKEITHDASPEPRAPDNPWQKERSGYGAPKKNPRCRRCGRQRFTSNPCTCEAPDWDTRTAEYARVMQDWHRTWATAALRVLKPGGHLLAFGGTRTYHRLACAVEDAGFEIRDCLAWMYGSGFPKSLDVSKAIDKAAGAEREVVRNHVQSRTRPDEHAGASAHITMPNSWDVTAPSTPEAQRWQGWGTALKPAFEPIVLARKPLVGSVAHNVGEHGTGALNIDGTRIEGTPHPGGEHGVSIYGSDANYEPGPNVPGNALGRWPANVVLDPEAAALLDEQTGERPTSKPGMKWNHTTRTALNAADDGSLARDNEGFGYGDTGGASRFFYCPKADREERDRGLEHRQPVTMKLPGKATGFNPQTGELTDGYTGQRGNPHPTVKPVELMRWLCRLVTPPGGLVLDPFMGSGSTGIAALRESFNFVGIEREADYVEIARDRIIGDAPIFNVPAEVV